MEFQLVTEVNYSYSKDAEEIMTVLNNLPEVIACDFETASRWTNEEKTIMKTFLASEDCDADFEEKRQINQFIESDGLSHPSLTYITHFSVAWSEKDGFVAILDNPTTRKLVLDWLVTTERKQIWHNLSFDGKLIKYYTGKLPINYEDSEILARCLLNHVETVEAKSGLKVLMGYKYGEWAVSKDFFNLESIYDEDLIKYAGIDACATYSLWEEMQEHIKQKEKQCTKHRNQK